MAGDRPHHQICCHDSLKDREMTLGQGLDLGPPPVLTHLNNHHLFWRNTEIWDNTKPGKHYIIFISVLSRGERGETRETAWCQYWQISVPGRGWEGGREGAGNINTDINDIHQPDCHLWLITHNGFSFPAKPDWLTGGVCELVHLAITRSYPWAAWQILPRQNYPVQSEQKYQILLKNFSKLRFCLL